MKTLRLVSTPTRNRRLNEILGMVVLVSAGLLLLALASYTPTDPSFNTVGQYVKGRPAHNWTGMVGAYLADAMLQMIGVAAFFLPLVLGRLGICWMRSRPAGLSVGEDGWAGDVGGVWAGSDCAVARGDAVARLAAVEGTTGRLLADLLVQYLNLPGAAIVLALMVAVSLYLATTFTFNTAREWATIRFGFVQRLWEWWSQRRSRRVGARLNLKKRTEASGSRRMRGRGGHVSWLRRLNAGGWNLSQSQTTLLGGLFGWLSGRRRCSPSRLCLRRLRAGIMLRCGEAMPRTLVDAPPVTAFEYGGGGGSSVC